MNDRLKEIRVKSGLNQEEFGKRLGVTAAAVSRWESGDRGIPDSAIRSICREFGVNEMWLRDGIGEPYASKTREAELGELFKSLFAERPESFRSALLTTLLRFDPAGPEWAVLEKIYENVAAEADQYQDPDK